MCKSHENPSDSKLNFHKLGASIATLAIAVGTLAGCGEKVSADNEPAPTETTQSATTENKPTLPKDPVEKKPTYAELNKDLIDPVIVAEAAKELETAENEVQKREILIHSLFMQVDEEYYEADTPDGGFEMRKENREKIARNVLSGVNTISTVLASPEVPESDKIKIWEAYRDGFVYKLPSSRSGVHETIDNWFSSIINTATTSDDPGKTAKPFALMNPFLSVSGNDYSVDADMPRLVAASSGQNNTYPFIDTKGARLNPQDMGTNSFPGMEYVIRSAERDEQGNVKEADEHKCVSIVVTLFTQEWTPISTPRVVVIDRFFCESNEDRTILVESVPTPISELLSKKN